MLIYSLFTFRGVSRSEFVLLTLLLILFLVWPLSGLIAIRHIILLSVLIFSALQGNRSGFGGELVRWPMWPILLLTAYFVVHLVLFSREIAWSWGELSGQLIKSVLIMAGGGALAAWSCLGGGQRAERVVTTVLFACLIIAVLMVATVIYGYFINGYMAFGDFPFSFSARGGKLELSFMVALGLSIVLVEISHIFLKRKALLGWSPLSTFIAVFVLLSAMFCAGARNGMIGLFFALVTIVVLWFMAQLDKRVALIKLLPVFLVLAVYFLMALNLDPRWSKFVETIPLAWDTHGQSAWLTRNNYPVLSSGQVVDISAYERIAWIKSGVELVVSHYPLGYGYGREVFAHALRPIWGGVAGGHSHSGYVDLFLMGGYPALLLWGTWIVFLLALAVRTYSRTNSPWALLLFFMVSSFNGRMLLDSIWRDHYLQIFFFMIGFVVALCLAKQHDLGVSPSQVREEGL